MQEVLEGYTFLNASVELSSGDQKCTAIIISCSIIHCSLLIHLQLKRENNSYLEDKWYFVSKIVLTNCEKKK